MAERRISPLPLALTMGEPAGVGPEITVAAWKALSSRPDLAFFVIGDPALYARCGAPVAEIGDPRETAAAFADALPVLAKAAPAPATPGNPDPKNAAATAQSIADAVSLTLAGEAGAVVTNPIHKAVMLAGGFAFPGHTEYLGALTEDAPWPGELERGPVMMIASPALRTVPITVHASVIDAVRSLTPNKIVRTARVTAEALKRDFGVSEPRLAISGLNPHAGEGGALGHEEIMIIEPAIDMLRAEGLTVAGPLAADTMFHEEARASYDAALCILHDQALIPAKTLAFHDGVNVTLGLPIVRTSPDHGTALSLAGKGVARADSLIAAIGMAAGMAKARGQW